MKINGSLVFDASSASEIQNLRVQKLEGIAVPAYETSDAGRVIFVTVAGGIYLANTLYYGNQGTTSWVAIATGGNAAALQTEVDAIETTLGAIINGSGVFVPGQVTGPAIDSFTTGGGIGGAPNTVTQILQALSNYANANNTLVELDDVTMTGLTTGDYLKYNGTVWVNDALTLADVTDVTATAAQVNVLATIPATLTGAELGFVDGVTSGIQDQLDLKQALDAGLTSMAALTGPGFVTVDATGKVVSPRSLVAPAAGGGLTILPADGSGNAVFALANDLAALEGLQTFGYMVRTADGTATTRAMNSVAADIVITGAADGVASDTTFGLAPVTQAASGNFVKVSLDTKGRVIGNTAVLTADITALVDGTYVNVTGDTMTGNLVMSGALTKITLPNTPLLDTDAVNKAYVDALTAGLSWKAAVRAASTGNLVLSGEQTVDGVVLVAGNRVLVKDQTAGAENGIYVVAAGAWVRALDMNDPAEFDGSAVFVQEGSSNEGQGFTETLTVTSIGTSLVSFSQFSGGQAFVFGVGLSTSGNTINVNMGAGVAQLPSDEVGLDIVANQALQLTSLATDGQLTLVLAPGSGLEQSSAGLTINAASVTNAMLVKRQFTINADVGTDALELGDTFEIRGTSTQGISTLVTESPAGTSTFTITAADATTAAKGVASFSDADFAVTGGVVTVKALGIDNAQMVNSGVTFAGTNGTPDAVALGETLTLTSTVPGLVSTTVGANSIALDVRPATALVTGVASFAAADFVVTAGEVTTVAKGINTLTDVTVVSAAAGQTLVYIGSEWVNRKVFHTEAITAAATTWTITHNIGQRYCNVTIADSTNEVVIPQSIVFNNANQLTVTFNTAIAGQVMVSGIAAV